MTSLCDLKMPITRYEIMLSFPTVLHSSSLVEKWRNAKRKAKKMENTIRYTQPQKCVYGYKFCSSWSFEMRPMPLESWDDFRLWWWQSILTYLATKGVKNAPEVKNWVLRYWNSPTFLFWSLVARSVIRMTEWRNRLRRDLADSAFSTCRWWPGRKRGNHGTFEKISIWTQIYVTENLKKQVDLNTNRVAVLHHLFLLYSMQGKMSLDYHGNNTYHSVYF